MNIHHFWKMIGTLVIYLLFPFWGYSHTAATSPAQTQQLLTQQQQLIHYEIVSKTRCKVSIFSPTERVEVNLDLPANFPEQVLAFHQLIQQFSIVQRSRKHKFTETSYQLYRQLIAPIQQHLQAATQLIILHKGLLQFLPFEVLLSNPYEAGCFSDMDFLVKRYAISYFTTLDEFIYARQYRSTNEALMAMAPVFAANASNNSNYQTEGNRSFSGFVSALPFSQKEVVHLTSFYQQQTGQAADLYLNEQADKQTFLKSLNKTYRFLHLATHSFADFENAQQSGILLAGSTDSCGPAYEVLTVAELEQLSVLAELVVLSSCQSGIGILDEKEGVLGIHRSLLKAGAANVLFSLWKINDKICFQFMRDFYQQILAGQSYANAIQWAKLQLLKNETTASPNVWAAFMLIGL